MSESILNVINEKVVHKQGHNWDVIGRFEDFESADNLRKKELAEGRIAKVQCLSTVFVVKVKQQAHNQRIEVSIEAKNDRNAGKTKRQDRNSKR